MTEEAKTGVGNEASIEPVRVVGIGASAGGLDALRDVLGNLPTDTGMAFVVVQHLDPNQKSLLVSLLQQTTAMPTVRIDDGMLLRADHVYVIPEQSDITVANGALRLQPRPKAVGSHEPFNVFLRSLASEWRQKAVGIVLSGSDQDGLKGMAAIKEAGGVVVAQDPDTAQYDSMPRHVVDAGLADAVLPSADIAQYVAALDEQVTKKREVKPKPKAIPLAAKVESESALLLKAADELLGVNDKRPAAIVDSTLQVQAYRGDVEPFLTVATGPATLDLARMTPPEVALELREMIKRASEGTPATSSVSVALDGRPAEMRLEVLPMGPDATSYVVLFDEVRPEVSASDETSGDETSQALRHELAALRLSLQNTLEEKDALNEELQASVEEAQSVNEELQTAKEELQSTNEELITVNDELQDRNAELITLNNDLTSLLTSVNIPIVVLGRELEIRRFTPSASKVLNVIPGDVGRPITDLRLKIEAIDLPGALHSVLESGKPHEQQVLDEDGRWYSLRLVAYQDGAETKQGVVLSLTDINEVKNAEAQLNDALQFVGAIFDTVRGPLVVLDSESRVVQANAAFYSFFQVSKKETEHKPLVTLGAGQWDVRPLTELLESVSRENSTFSDFAVTYRFPDIGVKTMLLNARRVVRPHSGGEFVLLAMDEAHDGEAVAEAAN